MHRVVAQTPAGLWTDHINRNKLDNRRENLRHVTKSENAFNMRPKINNTTGHSGVFLADKPWRAAITVMGRLGGYKTKEEAVDAYHRGRARYFQHYAEPHGDACCELDRLTMLSGDVERDTHNERKT